MTEILLKEEVERIKKIIEEVLEDEELGGRLRPPSRIKHVKKVIFFRIDNPDYVRKTKTL